MPIPTRDLREQGRHLRPEVPGKEHAYRSVMLLDGVFEMTQHHVIVIRGELLFQSPEVARHELRHHQAAIKKTFQAIPNSTT